MPKLCIGKTVTGLRCEKEALFGSNYCSIHKSPAPRYATAKKTAKKTLAKRTLAHRATKKAAKKTAKKK